MNRLTLSLIGLSILFPVAASAAPMTVLQYEAKTSLSDRWERDQAQRALIEQRIRANQTNLQTGATNDTAVDHNKVEVQKYSDSYLCMSKKATNRCKAVDGTLQH